MSTASRDPNGAELAAQGQLFVRDGYLVDVQRVSADVARGWCRRSTELTNRTVEIDRQGDDDRLLYTVLTGDVIREEMNDLYAFYTSSEMRAWVAATTGEPEINVSSSIRSAINVNILRSTHSYHWHFDANPYTVLLYLTDHAAGGGELEIYPNLREGRRNDPGWDRQVTSPEYLATREKITICPSAGMLVLLDGSVSYHRIAPLMANSVRVSAPLVYLPHRHETRAAGLDDYLYGALPARDVSRANSAQ